MMINDDIEEHCSDFLNSVQFNRNSCNQVKSSAAHHQMIQLNNLSPEGILSHFDLMKKYIFLFQLPFEYSEKKESCARADYEAHLIGRLIPQI